MEKAGMVGKGVAQPRGGPTFAEPADPPDRQRHPQASYPSLNRRFEQRPLEQHRPGRPTAGTLTAMMRGNEGVVRDDMGGTSVVTIADVFQSNGVTRVVDKVLLPG
jgi:hypothetical protein